MCTLNRPTSFFAAALMLAMAVASVGCVQTNDTSGTANGSAASPTLPPSVSPTIAAPAVSIETREPEQYRGTLVFTAELSGKPQTLVLPIEIARNGENHRYAFELPAGGQVILLDRADKRYLVMPVRKQYAELTPDTIGFDVRSLTLGQMVTQLQKQRNVERVGEEQLDGRTVVKYRHSAITKTGTQAGDVVTQSFVYVDKETGLPLRAEGIGQATGTVQGANSGRIIAEMRDLQLSAPAPLFEVPTKMTKLTPEQVKQQMSALAALFQVLISSLNVQATGGNPSPAVSPSPTTASPSPTVR